MKHLAKILMILLSFSCITSGNERYILGGRWAGLFSNIFGVINHLIWCEQKNKDLVVYWTTNPAYYYVPTGYNGSKNIWEYYFYPVSNSKYHPGNIIHDDYLAPDNSAIEVRFQHYHRNFSYEYRKFINQYIEKYIHIKENILNKIDNFYQKNMIGKKTIGIHVRRTDHNEAARIPLEKYIEAAHQFKNCQYFVATDDQYVLDQLKEKLHGHVLSYDSYRATNDIALHLWNPEVKNKALMGEQVLIEAKLLSLCDHFIHAVSNVSLGVLFFNPDLPHTYLE